MTLLLLLTYKNAEREMATDCKILSRRGFRRLLGIQTVQFLQASVQEVDAKTTHCDHSGRSLYTVCPTFNLV